MNDELDQIVKYGDSSRSHRRQVPLIWLTLAFALTAGAGCTRAKPVPFPNIQVEDSKERYYLRVEPSPKLGKVEKASIRVHYAVQNNRDCIPMDYTLAPGGIHPQPIRVIDFDTKIIEDVIETDFPASHYKDEDYYGLGVCRWGINQVDAELTINNDLVLAGFGPEELERSEHLEYCSVYQSPRLCGIDRVTDDDFKIKHPSIKINVRRK